MPITPVNRAKNTVTLNSVSKVLVLWADTLVTWGDVGGLWGSGYKALSTRAKNVITPVNKIKN